MGKIPEIYDYVICHHMLATTDMGIYSYLTPQILQLGKGKQHLCYLLSFVHY